jgi:hypothetical protein
MSTTDGPKKYQQLKRHFAVVDMECLKITMPKTRSFCHIDLVHKTADFSPWEKDKWTAFLRIINSYNRTRLLRFELGFCRWICLNGMIFGRKSIEFSYAHTRRGTDRVDRFLENVGDIRKLETALTERLHKLKRYHVPEKKMLPLLCRTERTDGLRIATGRRDCTRGKHTWPAAEGRQLDG